ncbi:wiskott-Aldrich syndrome protein homolog [Panicum virgatum]|uniref:Uncharacterized protein n=1 Tax=Panicum virgatum TaxID=38727 RepID=A0A8T0X1S6_PANVG|nr:wiskott-Aldrich syndrome protein homolog [Panicum virgatum]KAG2652658.1 hypothetical protein PVAP13_1NG370000 [Panicum virgatum]
MRPGGYYYPRASAPFGGYGNGNGGGFRQAGGQQPYRPPPRPPEQRQMTLQQREAVLMAAGRLAAEYLVDRGDLPPDVLENRPPAPIPFQQQGLPAARFHQSRGPPQQQHRQPVVAPRPASTRFQQRPHRRFAGPRPFQFHGGPGPFPKRPRQGPPRSFPYGPRAAAAPPNKTTAGSAGQGAVAAAAAPPVAAKSDVQEDEGSMAVDGDAGESQTTAQPGGATSGAPEQVNEPSSTSVGANDSESK